MTYIVLLNTTAIDRQTYLYEKKLILTKKESDLDLRGILKNTISASIFNKRCDFFLSIN